MASPDMHPESDGESDSAVHRIAEAVTQLADGATESRPLTEDVRLLDDLHNELQSALTDLDRS